MVKFFKNRTFFSQAFYEWMKRLSYRKSANRESFLYASELFLIDSNDLLKEKYKNHSFNILEIMMIMARKNRYKVGQKLTHEEIQSFFDILFNLMYGDNHGKVIKQCFLRQFFKINDSTAYVKDVIDYIKIRMPLSVVYLKEILSEIYFKVEIPMKIKIN